MFECRVERDSVYDGGPRLTSFVISYPRIVLAEAVTHRTVKDCWGDGFASCERNTTEDISKNSASSRAIPYEKMAKKIKDDPYVPDWTLNRKGMQGLSTDDQELISKANRIWLNMRDYCLQGTSELHALGVHKQDVNRPLETWAGVTQVVTSSRWDNYFALRCHEAAHPALRKIARMMYLARKASTPRRLEAGQWHLPFVPLDEQMTLRWAPSPQEMARKQYPELPDLIKHSAARCAWVSYENHDKDGSPEAMLKTWDRLFAEVPVHASPVEHQLSPMLSEWEKAFPWLRSNISGWLQARKLLKHEEITEYSPTAQEIASWGEFP